MHATTDNVSQNTVIDHSRRLSDDSVRRLSRVPREHRRLRVGLLRIEEEEEGRTREREKIVSIFRERPSSRVPFCQKRIKRGKRGVFLCSTLRTPVDFASTVRNPFDHPFLSNSNLSRLSLSRSYKDKTEEMEIFEESSSFLTRSGR